MLSNLDVDEDAGCMDVLDSEEFVLCGQFIPAVVVFPGGVS